MIQISTILGVGAAIVGLFSYLHKEPTRLKVQIGASSQVWALYFLSLGLITAAYVQVLLGLRTWIFMNQYRENLVSMKIRRNKG